ncbi:hypothetical protein OFL77_26965, partial [Escherichia coli]|uniref:hypothetical protein n=1 Tax=Escherichia coli TaxID=562 RepID=UPI0021E03F45
MHGLRHDPRPLDPSRLGHVLHPKGVTGAPVDGRGDSGRGSGFPLRLSANAGLDLEPQRLHPIGRPHPHDPALP